MERKPSRAYLIMHENKEQIIDMWNEGHSRVSIAEKFYVSDNTVKNYLRFWQEEEPHLFER